MQPTPEQTTMASKQNWNIKHINNCNVGVLYYDAQTPKYGNGVLFHFRPIHPVHIGETTKSRDQLATQISTNLLRGRNRWDIRKTVKGIRMFRTTYLPIVTILDSFLFFFVFFCLKGTLPKVRCLLKATIFCDIYWHRTPMPKPWDFSSRLLPTSNTSSQAQTIRRLWPNKCNLSGAVQNGWLSCFILTVSYPKNSR